MYTSFIRKCSDNIIYILLYLRIIYKINHLKNIDYVYTKLNILKSMT